MKKFVPLLIFLMMLFTGCHVARYFFWNFADVNDHTKFPFFRISPSPDAVDKFRLAEEDKFNAPLHFNGDEYIDLTAFLNAMNTTAFLILKRDTIIYEHYFEDYSDTSLLPSFSVTKSVVSALTGIAVSDGLITSIEDPVSKYIPEMAENGFDTVSIRNLLNMRSGIKFSEGYFNPFGEMAKFYYGTNLRKYTLDLKVVNQPGRQYIYQSGNTQILAMILQRVSGMNLARYLEEKIWKKAGMCRPATWNYDSDKHKMIKAFCCLNATARDFARFGNLYVKNGSYEGRSVIPAEWIEQTMDNPTNSRDSRDYPYHFHWRVLENRSLFAKGILGQYILAVPEKDLVMLRFGRKDADLDWIKFMQYLQEHYAF